MKVIGKLLEIQETQQVSDAFKKRVFILEHAENAQYLRDYAKNNCSTN